MKYLGTTYLVLGVYNYRADHLNEAVTLASSSEYFSKALNVLKGCVSSPIGLSELQVIEYRTILPKKYTVYTLHFP